MVKTQKRKRKKKTKQICQNCARPGGCNNVPFLSTLHQNGNTSEYWAHMGSIIIPWNSAKSKVGNKENMPLIWGLPQAGCEGNLGVPVLIGSRFQIRPPYWNRAGTVFLVGLFCWKKGLFWLYLNKCLTFQRGFLQTRSDCPGVIRSRWTGPGKENSKSHKRGRENFRVKYRVMSYVNMRKKDKMFLSSTLLVKMSECKN